jgi:hypothetical protein
MISGVQPAAVFQLHDQAVTDSRLDENLKRRCRIGRSSVRNSVRKALKNGGIPRKMRTVAVSKSCLRNGVTATIPFSSSESHKAGHTAVDPVVAGSSPVALADTWRCHVVQPADRSAGCVVFQSTCRLLPHCRKLPQNALGCPEGVQPMCNQVRPRLCPSRPGGPSRRDRLRQPSAESSVASPRRRRGRRVAYVNNEQSTPGSSARPTLVACGDRSRPGPRASNKSAVLWKSA